MDVENEIGEQWEPKFDPQQVQNSEELSNIEANRLSEEELQQWGVRVSAIRCSI